MEVIHRFVVPDTPDVAALLERTNRHCDENNAPVSPHFRYLVAYASSKEPEVVAALQKAAVSEIRTLKYAKDELMAAEWLIVRPAWQQYSVTNIDYVRHPCPSCTLSAEQTDGIVLSADIKKCKRSFLAPAYCKTFLVDSETSLLLSSSDLSGFSFRPVYARSKKTPLQSMSQIVIENILPPALANQAEIYKTSHICERCGTFYGALNGDVEFRMHREVMAQQTHDIYTTFEHFGDIAMERVFVMSQKFFHFLAAHGLRNSVTVDSIVRLV